jgi:hypothetical protein
MNDIEIKTKAVLAQHGFLGAERYRITAVPRTDKGYFRNLCRQGDTETFFTVEDLVKKILELRTLNARGYDIYITPIDTRFHYIVVDDLTPETLAKLLADGYKPTLVQKSSQGNYQAIMKVEKLNNRHEQSFANTVVLELNKQYGDPKFSGVVHPFRLAGFSNKKPGRNNAFTQVVKEKSFKTVCPKTTCLLNAARASKTDTATQQVVHAAEMVSETILEPMAVSEAAEAYRKELKKVVSVIVEKGWTPDPSRIDFRVSKALLEKGYPKQFVITALLSGSEGLERRHANKTAYVLNTVNNAARACA